MPSSLHIHLSALSSLVRPAVLVAVLVLGAAGQTSRAQPGPQDTTRIAFGEAVRIALDQNTDIKRAQATARQSNLQVQSEWMDFLPDASIRSSVSRRYGRNFSQVTGDFTTRSTDFFNLGGNSSLTIFNGFENTASLTQAQTQADADRMSLKQSRREVVFTVVDQFIALAESRELVRVRREELDTRRQQLEQIRAFVEAGSRPVSDLYTQQADVADAEQQLLQAEREREVSKTRLIQTLQLSPRKAYAFQQPGLQTDSARVETYDLSALIDQAFQQRLDLEVARAEQRAAETGIRAARSSYYPSLSISGNYGSDWSSRGLPGETTDNSFGNQLDINRGGSVSFSLNIPIFNNLNRSAQVEQAQVQAQSARYALQDQRQQVALQVRQAYLDYRNAVKQLDAATKRLRAARQSRDATLERYNLGSASIVELQNARRDFVSAASDQVQAQYQVLFQRKRIDYRVGTLDPNAPLADAPTAR
jgi:outer membrane protein